MKKKVHTKEENFKIIKEQIANEKKDYINKRESFIKDAIKYTNKRTDNDQDHPDWNKIYFAKMDELSFKAGIQSARFHKDVPPIKEL